MVYIKNIIPATVHELSSLIELHQGEIVSKTLAQNKHISITLFGFGDGEEISTHTSRGDAMVDVLSGIGQLTIDGTAYQVHAGETIVMPANIPHAVTGIKDFKMKLTVVFPQEGEKV